MRTDTAARSEISKPTALQLTRSRLLVDIDQPVAKPRATECQCILVAWTVCRRWVSSSPSSATCRSSLHRTGASCPNAMERRPSERCGRVPRTFVDKDPAREPCLLGHRRESSYRAPTFSRGFPKGAIVGEIEVNFGTTQGQMRSNVDPQASVGGPSNARHNYHYLA